MTICMPSWSHLCPSCTSLRTPQHCYCKSVRKCTWASSASPCLDSYVCLGLQLASSSDTHQRYPHSQRTEACPQYNWPSSRICSRQDHILSLKLPLHLLIHPLARHPLLLLSLRSLLAVLLPRSVPPPLALIVPLPLSSLTPLALFFLLPPVFFALLPPVFFALLPPVFSALLLLLLLLALFFGWLP